MKVAVLGASGRMGATVCRAVEAEADLELVAAVDPAAAGARLSEVAGIDSRLVIEKEAKAVTEAGAEAVVDFTVAGAAVANLLFAAAAGVHAVCGTTGIEETDRRRLAEAFSAPGSPNCVLAPNFAVSAVLMIRLAELAAPLFDSCEVIELHHDEKADAPSGTALETARAIAAARRQAGAGRFGADPTTRLVAEGARGAELEAGVHVHSVRLRGLVAHEEILFGALGQSLTIRQDSYDRSSFMPGVLLALRKVASTPGLTEGLAPLLGV